MNGSWETRDPRRPFEVRFWSAKGLLASIEVKANDFRAAALRAIPHLAWLGHVEFAYAQVRDTEGGTKTYPARGFGAAERRRAFEVFHEEREREAQRRAALTTWVWWIGGAVLLVLVGMLAQLCWRVL